MKLLQPAALLQELAVAVLSFALPVLGWRHIGPGKLCLDADLLAGRQGNEKLLIGSKIIQAIGQLVSGQMLQKYQLPVRAPEKSSTSFSLGSEAAMMASPICRMTS